MMKNPDVLLGKIMCHDEVVGTGFFLDSKTILTAKHVVAPGMEDIKLKKEKTVELCLYESDIIQATSLNLIDAIDKRIDCVLLSAEEVFEEAENIRLRAPENNLQDYECKVVGYPKELGTLIELDGQIMIWEITGNKSYDMIVSIEKQDKLQNYEGISGDPIIVCGDVLGFAARQLQDNRIAGISLKGLRKFFPEVYSNKIVVTCIRKATLLHSSSLMEKCNVEFFEKHLKQVLKIAGPRYVQELNVENETFVTINKILDRESIEKEILEAERKWNELEGKLCNSIGNARDTEQDFLNENIENIKKI